MIKNVSLLGLLLLARRAIDAQRNAPLRSQYKQQALYYFLPLPPSSSPFPPLNMSAGASQAVSLIEVALREPAKATLRKNFNLVELCLSMHGFGVGKRFARHTWDYYQPNSYFTISRIVVKRMVCDIKYNKYAYIYLLNNFSFSTHYFILVDLIFYFK